MTQCIKSTHARIKGTLFLFSLFIIFILDTELTWTLKCKSCRSISRHHIRDQHYLFKILHHQSTPILISKRNSSTVCVNWLLILAKFHKYIMLNPKSDIYLNHWEKETITSYIAIKSCVRSSYFIPPQLSDIGEICNEARSIVDLSLGHLFQTTIDTKSWNEDRVALRCLCREKINRTSITELPLVIITIIVGRTLTRSFIDGKIHVTTSAMTRSSN